MKYCLVFNDFKKSFQKIMDFDFEKDPFKNKMIGDVINGDKLQMDGLFQIMGGSTNSGIPMNKNVFSKGYQKYLFKKKYVSGFRGKNYFQGIRKKKTVHGNKITSLIYQINLKKL